MSWQDLHYGSLSVTSQYAFNPPSPIDALSWTLSSVPSVGDNIELISRPLRCSWPRCSSVNDFKTVEKHKIHLKHHAQEVSDNWTKGQKCPWPDCSSKKASYKSKNLFDAHLNNFHINPLVCTVVGCKHKTPFRANHDLQRHIATAHDSDAKYWCPYKTCGDSDRRFVRRDKWLSHLKEHHETEPCPYAHCQRQLAQISLSCTSTSKHIGKDHGSFECALKPCDDRISRFSEIRLMEHMELHHAMEWALVLRMKDTVKETEDHVLRPHHLPQGIGVRACNICWE
jgi:hypothetical protein